MLNAPVEDVTCLLLLESYKMPHKFLTFGLLLVSVRGPQGLSKMWRASWDPTKTRGRQGWWQRKLVLPPGLKRWRKSWWLEPLIDAE